MWFRCHIASCICSFECLTFYFPEVVVTAVNVSVSSSHHPSLSAHTACNRPFDDVIGDVIFSVSEHVKRNSLVTFTIKLSRVVHGLVTQVNFGDGSILKSVILTKDIDDVGDESYSGHVVHRYQCQGHHISTLMVSVV